MVYTGLGEEDEAIEWWQRAVSERSRFALFFEVWPVFDSLSDSPRFRALVDQVSSAAPQSM